MLFYPARLTVLGRQLAIIALVGIMSATCCEVVHLEGAQDVATYRCDFYEAGPAPRP